MGSGDAGGGVGESGQGRKELTEVAPQEGEVLQLTLRVAQHIVVPALDGDLCV